MRPAITKKRPSTIPAGAMKRPGIMPTSPTVTTCMRLTMRKKPQSITSKSTVPSNISCEKMLKAALERRLYFLVLSACQFARASSRSMFAVKLSTAQADICVVDNRTLRL
jgi:hypothetical protein